MLIMRNIEHASYYVFSHYSHHETRLLIIMQTYCYGQTEKCHTVHYYLLMYLNMQIKCDKNLPTCLITILKPYFSTKTEVLRKILTKR